MEESGRNISDGHAAPIQTSNTYVGLAQKTFVFASAADAETWALLQGAPSCIVYDNDGNQIASSTCVYDVIGTSVTVSATFTTRVNTSGAVGIQNTYGFRFVDITGDILPQSIGLYH